MAGPRRYETLYHVVWQGEPPVSLSEFLETRVPANFRVAGFVKVEVADDRDPTKVTRYGWRYEILIEQVDD